MASGPGHRPLIILRWIFLGLLMVVIGAVVRMYVQRGTDSTPRTETENTRLGEVGRGEVVLAAEGFEYEAIEGGETLFLIRSTSVASDRENRYRLEGVRLTMESEAYVVESDEAEFDVDTRNARLRGSVRMAGRDGLELRGESFDLKQHGRILVSLTPPALFRLPGGYTGTARAVRINRHHDTVLLTGDVTIESPPGAEPPLRWTASRMLYDEGEGLLRSEGPIDLRRGDDTLTCRRMTVGFHSDEGEVGGLRFIQARWQVAGSMAVGDGSDRAQRLGFDAEQMVVEFDETGDDAESVVLEGKRRRQAELRLDDGAGLLQTVRSQRLFATFTDGAVSQLESQVPAVVEEGLARPGAEPLRRLCGDTLVARVDRDGRLEQVELDGAVDYRDRSLAARGERLAGDPENSLRLTGQPAELLSARAEVQAPEIVYSRGGGSLRATGGVRATSVERSGVELATGEQDAPVMVSAEEATWSDEPAQIAFIGNVRAWQGESFVLADRLTSLEESSRLEGEGTVKTVWKPPPDDPRARRPIEVNAERFVYLRDEGRLDYSQAVRVHEAGRTLRCNDLELTVDGERRIENLFCQGNAVVEDPLNGRTVRGTEATYTPADQLVLISGQPVVMTESDGARIEGRRLRYDLDSGEVQVLSEPRITEQDPDDGQPSDDG